LPVANSAPEFLKHQVQESVCQNLVCGESALPACGDDVLEGVGERPNHVENGKNVTGAIKKPITFTLLQQT
jgi:hypothetical protein